MPSDEAKAAFDEAQRIAAEMRDIYAQGLLVAQMRGQATDAATIETLRRERSKLQQEWATLAGKYTEAVGRFSRANDKATREHRQRLG